MEGRDFRKIEIVIEAPVDINHKELIHFISGRI